MTEIKDVLVWANEVCKQALTEARGGNTALVNRIGANSAMKLYFDNVHGLKSVADTQFPAYYAGQFKEITRLYEEYQRDQETEQTTGKVAALEAKIDSLEKTLRDFIESQTKEAPVTEAEKPKAKGGKKVEDKQPEVDATEAEDATAEDSAESEA